MRVAVVHEWLTVPGGSERVVLEILDMFPAAEIYTSVYDPAPWPATVTDRPVHVSYLDRIPGARTNYPKLLPLMNAAFESFDLSKFDLVISSSHSCAKNVITTPSTRHVCYCHTPMRHAWDPSFLESEDIGGLGRLALPLLLGRLRRQDVIGATRPDVYVANSTHVAARIAKYYRRDAHVIHPPVDVERFERRARDDRGYYLYAGRVVPYKRVPVAVAACERLGRPLKVVGDGRAMDAVRAAAGPHTELLGHVTDQELPELVAGARALLFPGEEDFGIVPVEAQAAGVPVIAYGHGGVRDSVIDGVTGVLYEEPGADALCAAIESFERQAFDETAIRENAARFAPDHFRDAFASVVAETRAQETQD